MEGAGLSGAAGAEGAYSAAGAEGAAGGPRHRAPGTLGTAGVVGVGAALGAATLVYVLHPFVPSLPVDSLDSGWESTLGEMADRGAVWGRDLAFTYGPASPLVSGTLNGAYLTRTLPFCAAVAAAVGSAAALIAAAPGRGRCDALAAAAALGAALAACGLDAVAIVLPLLLALPVLGKGGRAPALVGAFGAAVMGATAMAKMSYPLAAAAPFLLGDGAALLRGRIPPLVVPFLGGIALAALAYGQPIENLPTYLLMQGEAVSGYAAAMSQPGPAWELALFAAFAAVPVAVAVLGARRGARGGAWGDTRRGGRAGWAAPAAVAATLFVLFKAGFVRHDTHAVTAWQGAALLAAVLAWGGPPRRRRAALAVTAAALLVLYAYVPGRSLVADGIRATPAAVARLDAATLEAGPAQVAAAARLAADPAGTIARYRADRAQAFADIAAARPIGPLPGAVDVLPSAQTRVLAGGLDLRPRPSFQEYSTYTAALAEANRGFIRGPGAPRWFLFGPEDPRGWMSIDGRLPALTEGALWLDLLSLYRPDHRSGELLALERRPAPAPLPLGPAASADAAFGAPVPVIGDGPVWATVDVRPGPLGRLAALLFRPPLVDVALRFADGHERRFRFLPALGRIGFLLSPLVTNASDFAILAEGRAAAPDRRVVSFTVAASPAARAFFGAAVRVTQRTVDLAALRATSNPSAPSAESPPSGSAWDRLAAATPGAAPGSPRIGAQAPASLSVPAEGLGRLTLGYGIDAAAGEPGRACFSILSADGLDALLWGACLDVGARPADRGSRSVSVALPAGTTEVELRTRCDGPCDAAPAYWAPAEAAEGAPRR